jgi:hypothetical protein
MWIRSVTTLLLIAAPMVLGAQPSRGAWTVGAAIVTPATLLDAGDGDVTTTLGVAIDLAKDWATQREIRPTVRARVFYAATTAARGSNDWAPGAVTSLDLIGALTYDVRPRVAIDVGAGASLWTTPADAAPFDALRGVRPVLDAGLRAIVRDGWSVRVGAAVTPISADAARQQSSGSFVRLSLGGQRAF